VFAKQKGADEAMIARLDGQLRCLDEVLQRELDLSLGQEAGAGAAGGMGAGCMAFLKAELKSGIDAVLEMVEFDDRLEGADLVITGEGRIDSQSVHGKVISGIAKRTSPRNVPLIAIVGGIGDGAEEAYDLGVTALFGTDRQAVAFEEFAEKTAENYRRTLEDILRLMCAVELRK
jgi:glycerate kinase